MREILSIIMIVMSIFMIISVLFQSRGSQVGMAFGGSGETYRSKKGVEKILFYITIVLSVVFACVSILMVVIK